MSQDYQYDSSKNSLDVVDTKNCECSQETERLTRESILVVTRNHPPLTGGMERLMQHTVEGLAERFDVTLIGPTGSRKACTSAIRVIECPASPFLFLLSAFLKGLPRCVGSRYRLILGGSGLVAPVTGILGKICGAKTAIFVHGLDLVVKNWIYQTFFIPSIRRHDVVIANSRNTRDIAVAKGCDAAQVRVLHPGSYIPDDDSLQETNSIRGKPGIGSSKLVLFVGRIIERKGLIPFLEKAWPRVIAAVPDIKLLVVGDTPEDALLRDPGGARKTAIAIENSPEGTVRFLGSIDDELLWQCYAAADALIFPLIRVDGDVEGFGMVAIEAAACGTPTVAFPIGGIVDAVEDGVNGRLVQEGDYAAFADAVIATIQGDTTTHSQCRAHANNFSWAKHQRKLISIIEDATQFRSTP